VTSGGETRFTNLDIDVTPRAGRALLWPSILNDDLLKADYRTMHEARPVVDGVKYAANAWLHLRDFRTPHGAGCAP
jgi:prolyl 4-hydroxylase